MHDLLTNEFFKGGFLLMLSGAAMALLRDILTGFDFKLVCGVVKK